MFLSFVLTKEVELLLKICLKCISPVNQLSCKVVFVVLYQTQQPLSDHLA